MAQGIKNLPVNAGDTGSVPDPRRSFMSPLPSLCSRALDPQRLKPGCPTVSVLLQENPLTPEDPAQPKKRKKKQCVETEDKNIFQYCVEDRSSIDYSVVVLGNHFKMKFQASEFYE